MTFLLAVANLCIVILCNPSIRFFPLGDASENLQCCYFQQLPLNIHWTSIMIKHVLAFVTSSCRSAPVVTTTGIMAYKKDKKRLQAKEKEKKNASVSVKEVFNITL